MVDGTADRSSILDNEPEMFTYGDLFHQLPRMSSEKFIQAQDGAAAHVFRALYPFVNQRLVTRIVDLGCGRGAILQKLQRLFADTYEGSSAPSDECWLELVGIDSDSTLIEDWKQSSDRGVSLEFALSDAVGIAEAVNKTDKTALLVLGHTIFHFARSLRSFEQLLSELTPVIWIIDCHRTWNDAVSTVTTSESGVVLEPVWEEETSGRIVCLRTAKLDEECVRRGLVRRADSSDERTQVIFETVQVAVTSDKLKEMLSKRGYFVSLSYEYYSSWGPMSSSVFVRDLRPDAKDANDSWYTAVSSALNEIFRPSALRGMENQFIAVRKAIKLYKVRCAAVILPFDRIHTFARYAPLDRGTIDNLESTALIWRGDQPRVMVLEEPSQDQDKYATAYGLFTCVLGRTSSIQVFPLRLIANYQMAQIDRIFNDYEASFFESCTADSCVVEPDRAFFLLPIFFGRLPLFVLVLQFGDTFSELDTGPGLFRSCLLDLHQQLREVINERFLRLRILRPFLRDAYNQLRSSRDEFSRGQLSPREISDQVYKDLEKIVLENAIEKPWKSWVLALPGTEIKLKHTVVTEQANLERMVRAEIERLRRDIFFRLSRELEEMGFFAADGERRTPDSEDDPHNKPASKHHRIILQHGLASEDKLSDLIDLDSRYQDVINWSAGKMSLLVRSGQEFQPGAEEAFEDLKAVYCRALENTGGPFRFSARRLECMVEIATGVRVEASIVRGCSFARPIEDDPCQGLFEILHDLKAYWNQSLPAISIKVEKRQAIDGAAPPGLAAEVLVDFSSALADGGMGQDSRHLLETLGRWCSTGTPPTEPDQTRLLIARMEVGPGVGGAAVWRSLHTELIVQELT